MLVRISRSSLPGAEQTTSIALIVMCPDMFAEIALEDNPCGLYCYCLHLIAPLTSGLCELSQSVLLLIKLLADQEAD